MIKEVLVRDIKHSDELIALREVAGEIPVIITEREARDDLKTIRLFKMTERTISGYNGYILSDLLTFHEAKIWIDGYRAYERAKLYHSA